MKIPVIPLVVAVTLISVVVYLFNSASSGKKKMVEPRIEELVNLDGDETEVAVAPDGSRLVAIASGDLWLFNLADKSQKRLTETPDAETFPAWAPDGKRVTFTRGADTVVLSAPDFSSSEVIKENATSLSWSASGRMAFVRDRALWVTDAAGINDKILVEADANPEILLRNPRFSPDSTQLAFIRTNLGLQGELWAADASTGAARSLVADRWSENPEDVGWLTSGQLVYLTNRSGAFGLWLIDLGANTFGPLTKPLDGVHLGRVGISVWQDHIYVPRHAVNSDIATSSGTVITKSPLPEFEPAASPDGKVVAYTVQKDNASEIWTTNTDGTNAKFHVLGTQPRFAANGFEVIYTQTDIEGHMDLKKVDIRDGSSSIVTDAGEIDFQPDYSPDGRTIVFSSGKSGTMALWSIPATGGKRAPVNDGGYYPHFSPDGRSVAYWNKGAIWVSDLDGKHARRLRDMDSPLPIAWLKGVPRIFRDSEVSQGHEILPTFDVLANGDVLSATVTSKNTAIWSITPTYVTE